MQIPRLPSLGVTALSSVSDERIDSDLSDYGWGRATRGRGKEARARAAREAAQASANAVAGGWAIENREELDVMAQQRCEAAVRTLKGPIRGDMRETFDMHPEVWLQTENRPSNAQVQQQLKRLRSQNRPGTKESAETMMGMSIKRARKLGTGSITLGGKGTGNWTHMVRDGEACADWAQRCRAGNIPPSPFRRDGQVGRNLEFRQSAVREHLRLQRDSDGEQP